MTNNKITCLLKEARATLEMWKDVAPAVSLCADIDKVLATIGTSEPVAQEPVYLVAQPFFSDPKNTWRVASKEAYDVSVPDRRRIVYAAPIDLEAKLAEALAEHNALTRPIVAHWQERAEKAEADADELRKGLDWEIHLTDDLTRKLLAANAALAAASKTAEPAATDMSPEVLRRHLYGPTDPAPIASAQAASMDEKAAFHAWFAENGSPFGSYKDAQDAFLAGHRAQQVAAALAAPAPAASGKDGA